MFWIAKGLDVVTAIFEHSWLLFTWLWCFISTTHMIAFQPLTIVTIIVAVYVYLLLIMYYPYFILRLTNFKLRKYAWIWWLQYFTLTLYIQDKLYPKRILIKIVVIIVSVMYLGLYAVMIFATSWTVLTDIMFVLIINVILIDLFMACMKMILYGFTTLVFLGVMMFTCWVRQIKDKHWWDNDNYVKNNIAQTEDSKENESNCYIKGSVDSLIPQSVSHVSEVLRLWKRLREIWEVR